MDGMPAVSLCLQYVPYDPVRGSSNDPCIGGLATSFWKYHGIM
jgi:hypothetical protein